MKKIGIITIGQSPRPDIVNDMAPFFGKGVKIIERGVLDRLTHEEVNNLSPDQAMLPLCTRMADGAEVIIAKEKILPRIQRLTHELNTQNVSLILILCVSSFPQFESKALLVYPKRIVDRCVEGLIDRSHRLGLVIPVPEQKEWAQTSFSSMTPFIYVSTASPYGDKHRLPDAAKALNKAHCDLIVMYCMGFTQDSSKVVRTLTGRPVILASSIVARTIGELLGQ